MKQVNNGYTKFYRNWPAQTIGLPNGDVILRLVQLTGNEPRFSLFEENHNIFCLTQQNELKWQVSRNDLINPKWGEHRSDIELGMVPEDLSQYANQIDNLKSNFISSFGEIYLLHRDGTTNRDSFTNKPPIDDFFCDGDVLFSQTWDSKSYQIDINTGIATLVQFSTRPW